MKFSAVVLIVPEENENLAVDILSQTPFQELQAVVIDLRGSLLVR